MQTRSPKVGCGSRGASDVESRVGRVNANSSVLAAFAPRSARRAAHPLIRRRGYNQRPGPTVV